MSSPILLSILLSCTGLADYQLTCTAVCARSCTGLADYKLTCTTFDDDELMLNVLRCHLTY